MHVFHVTMCLRLVSVPLGITRLKRVVSLPFLPFIGMRIDGARIEDVEFDTTTQRVTAYVNDVNEDEVDVAFREAHIGRGWGLDYT